MCGIVGVVGGPTHSRWLQHATDALSHRGPDAGAVWSSPSGLCGLGHRRLKVLDLTEDSAQPFHSPDRNLTLNYNGEIYNYVELRKELEPHWDFRSAGDTEVLLAAFHVWGVECLQRLNGMFAFAVWNERDRSLFAARDRFGEKPFNYALVDGTFVFASEAKAFVGLPIDRGIDEERLISYLTTDTANDLDSSNQLLLKGVKQLLPSQWLMVVNDPVVRVEGPHTYWSLDGSKRCSDISLDDAADELRELLKDSVRLRLRSDVSLGSSLSGGLDSSSIVALIRDLEPSAAIKTFTGRWLGDPSDEGPYANLVSQQKRTQHHEVLIRPEDFLGEAETFFRAVESPVGGLSQYGQWRVFRKAAEEGVTVLLDGQGSDELFAGYGHSLQRAYMSELIWSGHLGEYLRERRAGKETTPEVFGLVPALKAFGVTRVGVKHRSHHLVNFLTSEGREAHESLVAIPSFHLGKNAVSRMLLDLSLKTMLPSLLRYGDRLSMDVSREVRLPFCDHRIAEFAFSLPVQHLLGSGEAKLVLRHAMKPLLPEPVLTRAKQGFQPPERAWLAGPLKGWLKETISSVSPDVRRFIDMDAVLRAIDTLHPERAGNVSPFWRLATVSAWDIHARGRALEVPG